ncbi:putative membrane protein [Escherichia coli]|nr:putative membrane protein [Escherichia coli]
MNIIYSLIVVVTLSLISFSSVAKTITAIGSTIDSTEKEISLQAAKQGKSYKILGAFFKNRVYMIAKLIPVSKNDAS